MIVDFEFADIVFHGLECKITVTLHFISLCLELPCVCKECLLSYVVWFTFFAC